MRHQSPEPRGTIQSNPRLVIAPCQRRVEPIEMWIVQEQIEQVIVAILLPFAGRQPVLLVKNDRDPGGRECVCKRAIRLQRMFEGGKRKARVDGQESPLGVRRHESGIPAAALPLQLISKSLQQVSGVPAASDAYRAILIGEPT